MDLFLIICNFLSEQLLSIPTSSVICIDMIDHAESMMSPLQDPTSLVDNP